jgi:hypothetical protein
MNAHQRRIAHRAGIKKNLAKVLFGFEARAGPQPKKAEVIVHNILDDFVEVVPHDFGDELPEVKTKSAPKKGVFASAAAFGAALEKRGFKRLGSGAYSTVYGKDGYDKVIKVSRCLDNWIDYVMWASKHGYAGTFAPKVYSWKRFVTGEKPKSHPMWGYSRWNENEWSVAVVERMKETLNANSQLARDFKIIERIHDLSQQTLLAELIMEEIIPGVGKFFKELHRAFHPSDVYGKNLMIRTDGTFCVTDPVCESIKTGAMRFKAGDFAPPLRNYYYELSLLQTSPVL